MKRLAVYYRKSTDAQDFASQKLKVEEWLASLPPEKKPETVTVFEDSASGKRDDRPGFNALLEAVELGEVDAVAVYRLDRLGRKSVTLMRLLSDWIYREVEFFAVDQPFFHLGAENKLRMTIMGMFSDMAEIERETIVSRVRAGLDAARKRGVKLGREHRIPVETRDLARSMRSEGDSIQEIAGKLKVSKSTVHSLLTESLSTKRPNIAELNPINGGH